MVLVFKIVVYSASYCCIDLFKIQTATTIFSYRYCSDYFSETTTHMLTTKIFVWPKFLKIQEDFWYLDTLKLRFICVCETECLFFIAPASEKEVSKKCP